MNLLFWSGFRHQSKVKPKALRVREDRTDVIDLAPHHHLLQPGWLMSLSLHSGRCLNNKHPESWHSGVWAHACGLYACVWVRACVCVGVRNRRRGDKLRVTERQREKESSSPGVDTTCLDSRWGRSDREVLMVCGAFSRGTVGHTHIHTHTHTCTVVIHPAPFMLVRWEVRCARGQREDKKKTKQRDNRWCARGAERAATSEDNVCKHAYMSSRRLLTNYGFIAGSDTTKRWVGYRFRYGNYVNSYVNKTNM